MKKILLILLLALPVLAWPGQSALARGFTDIQDHWAKGYIGQLADAGVISGYPDGTFRPEGKINRSEFIKMLVVSSGLPLKPTANPSFTDVLPEHGLYPYIETAVAAGIVVPAEYVQTAFSPDEPVTRVETAMFLARALGLGGDSTYTGFDDGSKIPQEFRGYVRVAKERNLMSGYQDGTFRPWNPITRAEACAILVRYIYEQGKGKGLVTISYDHQLPSVYENAFPIHQTYGFPGVNYVTTSSVGAEGNMTVKQLQEMERAGWETASHSANHLHFKDLETTEIRKQLERSQQWLKQQGLAGENFAYPFRIISPHPLVKEYYSSGATSYDKKINVRPIYPHKLNRYYLQSPGREEIKEVLDKTVSEGCWVIFYTHNVYKGNQKPDSKSINQEQLEFIFEEVARRNIQVVTVKQGLQLVNIK